MPISEPSRHQLEWQEAYARLEHWRQVLEHGLEPTPEDTSRILLERARELARPTVPAEEEVAKLHLVEFMLAGKRLAVDLAQVLAVISLQDPAPVPGVPPVILGVVVHRGKILTVLDLRPWLESTAAAIPQASWCVAVTAGGKEFGLLAEAILGLAHPRADGLAVYRKAQPPGLPAFIRALTPDQAIVLDLETLARDRRVAINQDWV